MRAVRRFVVVMLALVGALSAAGACTGGVRIEPSPPLPQAECTAPDVVDGVVVTPVAVGDTITGDLGTGDLDAGDLDAADPGAAPKLAFCAKPGTWVRFSFAQTQVAQQPMLFLERGSETLAENRFFGLDADKSAQLFVPDDAVYTISLAQLNTGLGTRFTLSLARPDADVVLVDDGAAAMTYGQEAWGTFAGDDDVHTVTLPAAPAASLLTVRAALAGFYGNGATTSPVVDVVRGGDVIASLDFTDKTALTVPLDAGDAPALRVRAAGFIGERPFYALEQIALGAQPPLVVAGADNDAIGSIAHAQVLSLKASPPDDTRRTATVVVELAPGDDDFFALDANDGDSVHFSCAAESAGSGLRGLEVDLRDDTGALVLRTHEEKHDHDVIGGTRTWMDPADSFAPSVHAGTFYGEVHATSYDDVVTSRYAICTAAAGLR